MADTRRADRAGQTDETLDLALSREVSVSADALWRGWTDPDLLKQWFCPLPWRVTEAEIDLRPGGAFRTVMEGPNGERNAEEAGCYLEIEPGRRLVWTDSLGPGFRPRTNGFLTAFITFEPLAGGGTRYGVLVKHADAEARQRHADMGFEAGWGTAFDQLVALVGPG
jgi:uncharacterized protein YndB with AHSA1/START domain